MSPSGAQPSCAHCELPLGRRPYRSRLEGELLAFCCPGCSLAAQLTRARGEPAVAAALLLRLGLGAFFAMNVMMVSMGTYAPYVYGDASDTADGPLFVLLRVLAGAFAFPAVLLLGGPILRSAAQAVAAGRANADLLVALALAAALGLSVWNLAAGRSDTYFETAVMLLVLMILGRFLEARARAEAGARIRAATRPVPESVTRVVGADRQRVSADDLQVGDVVEVDPGQALPSDAVVLEGTGYVDESCLTGESRPVVKRPGSEISGGTRNLEARLLLRVTRPRAESAAARIEALFEQARREPSRMERTADRWAAGMVPAVLLLAALVAGWWGMRAGLDRGLLTAIAVLVVACPCALGIATPVAVWSGLAAAAARGVVVRSAPCLERAAAVRHVVFDKTGTLTDDSPRLEAIAVSRPGLGEDELLARVAALEEGIPHPIARALVAAARARGLLWPRAEKVRIVPGRGVSGVVAGEPLAIESCAPAARGKGVDPAIAGFLSVVAPEGEIGRLRLREALRPGARRALDALRAGGVGVSVLSGDSSAGALREAFGSDLAVRLRADPADKLAQIRGLRDRAALAMVGDGMNDAPALAAADLGIAVANASDLARLSADVVVLGSDLGAVPWLLEHARRVQRIVRQNLAWAVAYNAVAVGLAAAGQLTPLVASLAMIASSMAVVANSRRLANAPRALEPVEAVLGRRRVDLWRRGSVDDACLEHAGLAADDGEA